MSQFIADRVDRLGDLPQAAPQLPDYFRDVGLSFERAAGATNAGRIVMATLLCIVASILAEWALRSAGRDLRARRRAQPIMTTTDRLAIVALNVGVELGVSSPSRSAR